MSGEEFLELGEVMVECGIWAAAPGSVEVGSVLRDVDGERGQLVAGVLLGCDVFPDHVPSAVTEVDAFLKPGRRRFGAFGRFLGVGPRDGGDPGGEGMGVVSFRYAFEAGPFPPHGPEAFSPAFDADHPQGASGLSQKLSSSPRVAVTQEGRLGCGLTRVVTPALETGFND
jgi:hypothetical protein